MKQLIRKILKEEVSERLKRVVKNKLSKDLSHAEIILDDDGSIWFIDRNEKYWYLEFEKSGQLLWRHDFFTNFFRLFSMERPEFEPIIIEWVEDLLNRKAVSTSENYLPHQPQVEDLLNRKVVSTLMARRVGLGWVEDILNQNKV